MLFADLRDFTARFDGCDPREASTVLRRFYRCAEEVLFPDAVIDKLIGDAVMAIYLPELKPGLTRADVPGLMLEHARALLRAVGYAPGAEPFVEMGVALDVGEAFDGNIGQRALYDFSAGRLRRQHGGAAAGAGSRRRGRALRARRGRTAAAVGRGVELPLKGKHEPQVAYRLSAAG